MKVKELLAELAKRDLEAEVFIEAQLYPHCRCGDYCYCSPEERRFEVATIDPFCGKVAIRLKGDDL